MLFECLPNERSRSSEVDESQPKIRMLSLRNGSECVQLRNENISAMVTIFWDGTHFRRPGKLAVLESYRQKGKEKMEDDGRRGHE